MQHVLDASAMLALLNQEPGHLEVESFLSHSLMSTVNVAEVLTVLSQVNLDPQKIFSTVEGLVHHIIDFDKAQALLVSELRSVTKPHGLSFGDRACLALAMHQKLPVVTADQAWGKLAIDVKIKLIR